MIERTTDMEAVARIINDPRVCKWVADDTSVLPYVPNPAHFYIMNEEKTGLGRIDQLNGIACMVHIVTLRELRGKTLEFAKEALDWIFKNTTFSKIISLAPEYNRAAIMFGKQCGFKVEGKITKSFLKNWKLHDQIVFGLSKYDKEALCQ